MAEPIIRLLFQYGRFTAADTAAMGTLLAAFALAMPFFSVVSLTTRAFYAIKDTKTPVKVATLSFVLNIGLSFLLKESHGALGLVIASTVAVIAQTLWLQRSLSRQVSSLNFLPLWRPLGQVLLAAGVLAVVLLVAQTGRAWLGWSIPPSRWAEAGLLAAEIVVGVLAYFAVMSSLGFAELVELRALLRRKPARRRVES